MGVDYHICVGCDEFSNLKHPFVPSIRPKQVTVLRIYAVRRISNVNLKLRAVVLWVLMHLDLQHVHAPTNPISNCNS